MGFLDSWFSKKPVKELCIVQSSNKIDRVEPQENPLASFAKGGAISVLTSSPPL